MKQIRIGNDIRIEWPVVRGEDCPPLDALDLTVAVRPSCGIVDWRNYEEEPVIAMHERTVMGNGGRRHDHGHPDYERERRGDGCCGGRPGPRRSGEVMLEYRVEDDKIIALWPQEKQMGVGEYDLLLYARKNDGGQGVVDQWRFCRLVAHSAEADAPDDEGGVEAVIAMQPVTLALSGLSAYDIAVKHGFEGSEEEWLDSLKGGEMKHPFWIKDDDGNVLTLKATGIELTEGASGTTVTLDFGLLGKLAGLFADGLAPVVVKRETEPGEPGPGETETGGAGKAGGLPGGTE